RKQLLSRLGSGGDHQRQCRRNGGAAFLLGRRAGVAAGKSVVDIEANLKLSMALAITSLRACFRLVSPLLARH
ncbi:hypothetical protein LQT98_18905, partial [Chromobacterium aquaticum]|uniref:hypothetical protein n=1 Tax=Chromobacterium aquaticum TaxID=467180 RepID=UPI001E28802E